MAITFTPPNFSGTSPEEKLKSMQSWLFQFSEQIQYALNNLDTSNFSEGSLEKITSDNGAAQTSNKSNDEFDALRAIIIKTADTVKSSYKEITETLKSDYLAISDFGEYSENSKMDLVKSALGVTQNFSRIEEVSNKLDTVEVSFDTYIKTTNAYIRTGYLEQLDTYGVAIGEEKTEKIDGVETVVFNQFATLTAEELAFWQNGVKLGYFQGDSLFVNGAIRLGRWAIDTSSGFTIKYV